MSERQALEKLAGDLATAARLEDPALATRATRVSGRLVEGRFHVMVVGEFKRGKSTLVNGLLGMDVLPTGVLPLTAVVTEVRHGQEGAIVIGLDGGRREISLDELPDYVTEAGNPQNARRVERVEARVASPLLATGVVLVDTPGLGSIHLHNSETSQASLLEADGVIVVLSADEPLSQEERQLLETVAQRRARTFVVVNKADHLEPAELEEVRGFITTALTEVLDARPRVFCVSARAGLAARRRGANEAPDAADWDAWVRTFERFAAIELVDAQFAAARAELTRVAEELRDAVRVRRAASDLDATTLAARVEEFRAAADAQRAAFADERVLLAHDVAALVADVAESLAGFARREPTRWRERLASAAATLPIRELESGLRAAVEEAVHDSFEGFRMAEAARVERAWSELAARFRARTQARVDGIRGAARDVFTIDLPAVVVPTVTEERERFSYLFLHVGSTSEGLEHLARHFLPAPIVRRRMLRRACAQLVQEFDKHAGRARWDLQQRLDEVRRRFEEAMRAELERTVDMIERAAEHADRFREATLQEREQRLAGDDLALAIANRALAWVP